jgi:hypothetical protein
VGCACVRQCFVGEHEYAYCMYPAVAACKRGCNPRPTTLDRLLLVLRRAPLGPALPAGLPAR